jgi:hypothetical protein
MPTASTPTYAEQLAIVALYEDGRLNEVMIVVDRQPRTYFLAFKVKGPRGAMYLCTRGSPQSPGRFYPLDVALRWVQEHLPRVARIELPPPKSQQPRLVTRVRGVLASLAGPPYRRWSVPAPSRRLE